jgi:hypothetical protein
MSEHQRRALVRLLGDEVSRRADRDQLLVFARHWLYERRDVPPLSVAGLFRVRGYCSRTSARCFA